MLRISQVVTLAGTEAEASHFLQVELAEMSKRPVRIANFSGYLGDRYSAFDEVMAGDPVDVLMGDYLAEITLASFASRYRAKVSSGYAEPFVEQLRPHVEAIAERGLKVVTNAGGFNPAGLARTLQTLCAEQGVNLSVAYIDGDNVLERLAEFQIAGHALEHLDTGAPLSTWGFEPIAANAYLGGWGIAAALRASADIVVCGRVTDASLTLGPAAWWHDWDVDAWDELAGAVVAGHIIECGPHAVGGNFTGFTTIPGVMQPGFPIAEIAADGSSTITKHARDGGAVTVDTVTAQLVYEIQGPLYLNPDVIADIASVRLAQVAPDRVLVHGVKGMPPPPTTKVALFAPIGYQIVSTIFVTGYAANEKIDMLREQIRGMLADDGIDELTITPLGRAADDPASQWEATVPVRIMATSREREPLEQAAFANKLSSLYLCSIPGFYQDTGAQRMVHPQPRIQYWPAILPMSVLAHRTVLADGREIAIAPPPVTTACFAQPIHAEPPSGPAVARDAEGSEPATTRRVPLGTIAYARSGDKGANSNVGIWVDDDRAWLWLRETLSTRTIRDLVSEAHELEIVRHEFPHLRAVHFVFKGYLGSGGSSNLRADQVGKAVGEYILAKHVDVPSELLARAPAVVAD
jgi:hypothetical protein